MSNLPGYLWVITIAGAVGVPLLTCLALYRGARDTGATQRKAVLLAVTAGVLLGGWFTASGVIAARGGYHTQLGAQPPWLPIATVTVLIGLLAATRIPVVAQALSGPRALSRLARPHVFRVGGIAFLIAMGLGYLPALFALSAGLGDFATGIAEPFVSRRLARGQGRRAALWFNLFGVADLVVALALGGLTGFQLIHVTPPNDAISLLPLAWIPSAEVPLLLALHVLSFRRLVAEARRSRVASAVGRPAARAATAAGSAA